MALFAIGDTHLSLSSNKPMDVFGGGWTGYVDKLKEGFCATVSPEDTVVVCGDVSWGMSLEEALPDFQFLHSLPGKKVLLKGNHDYWWTTQNKLEQFIQRNGLESVSFLHNSCVCAEGFRLCGTRGWLFENGQAHDEKILAREAGRLRLSLDAAADSGGELLVFLHYPPVSTQANAAEIIAILHEFGVKRCFYGHLHGASIPRAVQGTADGVEYRLISADALRFFPYKI